MSQVEQLFLDRIKVIGEGEYTMFGVPAELIVELDRLLAERDIDAMLDAVHPQARLNYLGYADFDLCWNAYLWTPDFVATTGTGPTRLEAIADACRKAREGQPRGLREDTTP